jgi:hypothetical protein
MTTVARRGDPKAGEEASCMEITEGDRETLLAHVPEDRAIGNTLMRLLRWNADRYWAVRDALLDDALIERGRGQSRSVRRVPAPLEHFDESATELAVGETAIAYAHEAELYEPMRKVIETSWAKDHKTDPIAVVVTATQGRRQTGGR